MWFKKKAEKVKEVERKSEVDVSAYMLPVELTPEEVRKVRMILNVLRGV
jgi:hypothetical protein